MTADKAYALYLAWKKSVGDVRKPEFSGLNLESDGSFRAIHGAADFDYNFPLKKLMVMRVLNSSATRQYTYDMPGMKADEALAKLEPYTMGGGEFFINTRPWLNSNEEINNPRKNTYCLKRDFSNSSISSEQFVVDVRWLIYWGQYWSPIGGPLPGLEMSGSDRAWKSPEEQAATRPALEKWAKRILSKKEPPTVKAIW